MSDIALKTLKKLREELDAPESSLNKKHLPTHELALGKEIPDHLEDKRGALDKGESTQAKKDLPTHKISEKEEKEKEDEDKEKLDEVQKQAADRVDGEKAALDSLHPEDASHGEKLPAQPSELKPDAAEKKLDEDHECESEDCEVCEEEKQAEINIKESIESFLSEEANLSEELKQKTVTLLEGAINAGVKAQTKRIQKLYESRLKRELARSSAELIESLDLYMDSIVEQWLTENKLAVDSGLHAELAENLMTDVRAVFTKHNVELPKDKVDLFAQLAEKVEKLQASLNEEITKVAELHKTVAEKDKKIADAEKREVLREFCRGLAETEIEKMETLAEGQSFESKESYSKKLQTLKESFLSKKEPSSDSTGVDTLVEGGIEKEVEGGLIETTMKTIARQVAKL